MIKGNPNYKNYIDAQVITTKLNLFEVCCNLIRDFGLSKARFYMKEYSELLVDFDIGVIIHAAILKLRKAKENLSMTDCIGYIIATKSGIRFLTGDEKFRNMPNVEFVK